MRALEFLAAAATIGLLATGLAGCREDEQNRPLQYEKGVYKGAADEELNEDQRRAIRQRGAEQRF